jgi:CheY-like chemotaxis protein
MPPPDILLVDASRPARYPMRLLLQRLGTTVRTADSAEQALELMAAAPPDAVLAARILPAMNALELLELMRSNSMTAMIPLIIYCPDGDWPLRRIALARGAAAVLTQDRAELELPALLAQLGSGNAAPEPAPLSSGWSSAAKTPVAVEVWRLPAANDLALTAAPGAKATAGAPVVSGETSGPTVPRRRAITGALVRPGTAGTPGATGTPIVQTTAVERAGHSFAVGAAFSAIALMVLALLLMAW